MINNRIFLILVIGIQTLVIFAGITVLTGLLNDRNNDIHDRVFGKLSDFKDNFDHLLEQIGNVDERMDEETAHYNRSATNSDKLDEILKFVREHEFNSTGTTNSSS